MEAHSFSAGITLKCITSQLSVPRSSRIETALQYAVYICYEPPTAFLLALTDLAKDSATQIGYDQYTT